MSLKIAVDKAIPYNREGFAPFGELLLFNGRELQPETVRDVDLLIVRTVTAVNAQLLEGSRVRFVGTATVGMDHLDLDYLDSRGIVYENATGCNANGVAEYVIATLLTLSERNGWDLKEKSLAVVGVGHVGSLVVRKADALGMQVLLCDPPLRESTGDRRYRDLDDVLDADVVTVHVPLTRTGKYPTHHLIGGDILKRLRPDQWVLNSSRGPVVDCAALREALLEGKLGGAGLDVWEGEPRIDYSLLELVAVGTSHIAGFSLDGKIRATEMMVEAISCFTGQAVGWDSSGLYPEPRPLRLAPGQTVQAAVASVVRQAYDILADDRRLRALARLPVQEAGTAFERLRTSYPLRPEFRHFRVDVPAGSETAANTLEALEFATSFEGGCQGH